MKAFLAFCMLLAAPAFAEAQDVPPPTTMPLEDQERREHFDKAMGLLNDMQRLMEQAVSEKRTQCLKAFGNVAFCECLSNNSPPFVDFMHYVAIVVLPRDDRQYAAMSADDRKLYDATRVARDKCVGSQAKAAVAPTGQTSSMPRQ